MRSNVMGKQVHQRIAMIEKRAVLNGGRKVVWSLSSSAHWNTLASKIERAGGKGWMTWRGRRCWSGRFNGLSGKGWNVYKNSRKVQ